MQKKRETVEIQRKSERKAVKDTFIKRKWEENRHRIKQVQVQEKIIHKKRLQYFIGRGAQVHYSPPLWQKSFHHICQQAGIVCSRFSCSDSTGPIWSTPPAASLVPDRRRRSHCHSVPCKASWELRSRRCHSDVGSHRCVVHQFFVITTVTDAKQEQLNEIKLTKNRRILIVFSWLFLSIVLVWQHEFM